MLRQKFKWPPEDLEEAETLITESTYRVTPTRKLDVVHGDASDNVIVECAVESGSECIISGDKHLLRLGQFEGVKIMTVAEFLREIQPWREKQYRR